MNKLSKQLQDISKGIKRESNIFIKSPDLLAPTAVFSIQNLRELERKLSEQISVIAEHQSAEAANAYKETEGME